MRRNADPRGVASRSRLVGCGNFRDLFSAHADVAAEAGGQQLSPRAARADPEPGAKGVKLNQETADYVANVWIDYALFAQAAAEASCRRIRPASPRRCGPRSPSSRAPTGTTP